MSNGRGKIALTAVSNVFTGVRYYRGMDRKGGSGAGLAHLNPPSAALPQSMTNCTISIVSSNKSHQK